MSVIWVTYLRNKNDQQKHESQLIEAEKTRLACSCSVGVLQGDASDSVVKTKSNNEITINKR